MGKSTRQHAGFRFFLDLLMGFGRGGCDAFRRIRIGDREAWSGNMTTNGVIRIDKPDLFGGDEGAGGVVGDLHVLMGASDQARHPMVVAAFGPLTSALRGVCTGFFTGQIAAIDPYPKPWKVQRTTIHAGWDGPVWYPEKASVTPAGLSVPAMNPAHVLMKVLTHRDCGRGLNPARIDLPSYQTAADTLHAEGFGLCLRWNRQVSVNEFLQQVCEHIGASQYVSRRTGLLTLALARGGYDVEDLPLFDYDSGLLEIEEDDNPTGWGAVNEVIVEWRDPEADEVRPARWQNLAAIQAYGKVSETVSYPGLPTADLGARVAQRDGEIRSGGAKRFNLVLDRRGDGIKPAGLFRIRAEDHGITDIVLRAADIRDGTLVDGRIRIVAVQDVFALDATAYVAGQPSTHVEPDRTPQPVANRHVFEASYRDLLRNLPPAEFALVNDDTGALAALARRPSGLSLDYRLTTRTAGNDFEEVATGTWAPHATLAASVGANATVLSFGAGADLQDAQVGEAVLVDAELMRIDAIDRLAGTLDVGRGCGDTVPAAHALGAGIWFVDAGAAFDPTEYVDGETVDARMLTVTTSGQLDLAAAPTDSVTMDQRQVRPYPPGNLRINGVRYPGDAWGELTIAWSHRDRVLQADQLVDTTAGHVGPEAGTTYTLRILLDGVLVEEQTGLTGTTASYTPLADGAMQVRVEAVRNGLASWQANTAVFAYSLTPEDFRLTSTGDQRVTVDGDFRITLE